MENKTYSDIAEILDGLRFDGDVERFAENADGVKRNRTAKIFANRVHDRGGYKVHYDWDNFDLSRVETSKVPFLLDHDTATESQLGVVESVDKNSKTMRAKIRFKENDKATEYLNDVDEGFAGGVSVGLSHKDVTYEWDDDEGVYNIYVGEPGLLEVSGVTIPAVVDAGFSAIDEKIVDKLKVHKESEMTENKENVEQFDAGAVLDGISKLTAAVEKQTEKFGEHIEKQAELQEKYEIPTYVSKPHSKNVEMQKANQGENFSLHSIMKYRGSLKEEDAPMEFEYTQKVKDDREHGSLLGIRNGDIAVPFSWLMTGDAKYAVISGSVAEPTSIDYREISDVLYEDNDFMRYADISYDHVGTVNLPKSTAGSFAYLQTRNAAEGNDGADVSYSEDDNLFQPKLLSGKLETTIAAQIASPGLEARAMRNVGRSLRAGMQRDFIAGDGASNSVKGILNGGDKGKAVDAKTYTSANYNTGNSDAGAKDKAMLTAFDEVTDSAWEHNLVGLGEQVLVMGNDLYKRGRKIQRFGGTGDVGAFDGGEYNGARLFRTKYFGTTDAEKRTGVSFVGDSVQVLFWRDVVIREDRTSNGNKDVTHFNVFWNVGVIDDNYVASLKLSG